MTKIFKLYQSKEKVVGLLPRTIIMRGTLILKEVSQMPSIEDLPPPNLQMQDDSWMVDYIQKVISVLEKMTTSDKEEYVKLYLKLLT